MSGRAYASSTRLHRPLVRDFSLPPMSPKGRRRGYVQCLPHWTRSGCWTRSELCSATLPDSLAASKCIRLRTVTLTWNASWPAWPRPGGKVRSAQHTSRSPQSSAGGGHARTRLKMSGQGSSSGWRASQTTPPRSSSSDCARKIRVRSSRTSYGHCRGE